MSSNWLLSYEYGEDLSSHQIVCAVYASVVFEAGQEHPAREIRDLPSSESDIHVNLQNFLICFSAREIFMMYLRKL